MTITPDTLEAIAQRLDADQLAHVGASWVARASHRRTDSVPAEPQEQNDPDTEAAFAELEPLPDRLRRHADRSRAVGIDDDLIGCNIARQLLDAGHSEEDTAKLIAEAGIDWRPRTADERGVAAIAELLALGMEPETVRTAFAGLVA